MKKEFVIKILIDLDGVLNQYSGNYDENYIPGPKEGVRNFLKKLKKEFSNPKLYLFSSRNLLLVSKWLIDNHLDKYFEDVTNIKNQTYIIIDDRAICFKGNYNETLKELKNFLPYYKN